MADSSIIRPEILIVDDILANRLVLSNITSIIGCNHTTARNGEEAISLASRQHFDLILMDLEMPVMNGLETTALIRTMSPNRTTPIIALTAHNADEIAEELKANGFSGIIEKPFKIDSIKLLVEKYCPTGRTASEN